MSERSNLPAESKVEASRENGVQISERASAVDMRREGCDEVDTRVLGGGCPRVLPSGYAHETSVSVKPIDSPNDETPSTPAALLYSLRNQIVS